MSHLSHKKTFAANYANVTSHCCNHLHFKLSRPGCHGLPRRGNTKGVGQPEKWCESGVMVMTAGTEEGGSNAAKWNAVANEMDTFEFCIFPGNFTHGDLTAVLLYYSENTFKQGEIPRVQIDICDIFYRLISVHKSA